MFDTSMSPTPDATPARRRRRRRRAAAALAGLALLLPAVSATASPPDGDLDAQPEFEAEDGPQAQSGPTPTVLSQTRLRRDGRVSDVAVTADGKFALVLGESTLQKVRLAPGDPTVVGGTNDVFGEKIVVHPNGRFAYAVGKNGFPVHVVNIAHQKPRLVRRILPHIAVNDIVLSPNGRWLYAKNGRSDGSEHRGLYVFSLATPGQPKRVAHVHRWDEALGEMVISANGNRIITTNTWSQDYMYRYDVSTPRQPKKLGGKRSMPFKAQSMTRSPDGRQLYVSGHIRLESGINFAKVRTSDLQILRVRRHNGMGTIPTLGVTPNNAHLVAAGGSVTGEKGFAVFQRQPFQRVGTYNDLATWVSGLEFSYAGATKGRFYQVVWVDDGSGGARFLVASRLRPS